ncbi:hypothetical protein L2D08_10495 [Domibacillus sp. PGB-M46]|uniref:hypothetical protein n=1 Tax=Domibacillus sp. PGB-M46 TaxID=2910255 RepID=UPI001F562AB5|nr:hypothetical protein [Domibacillus sp. PGB-M46]MCI2254793.1 hypothetical protein [Domibacillus sp. PGB-M46]
MSLPSVVACCSSGYMVERNGRAVTMGDMIAECESFPALVGVVDVNKPPSSTFSKPNGRN